MSIAGYIPLASMSPINRKIEGHLVVAIKAYCDGSGKYPDPNCKYLTLGACIATPDAWTEFEKRWATILNRLDSPPLHMKDARFGANEFEGWSESRVDDLLSALRDECFIPIMFQTHRDDFYFASCTVNLPDFECASLKSSGVRSRTPAALCAYHIAEVAKMMLPDDKTSPTKKRGLFEMWFDHGEDFQHFVQKEWEQRKKDWHKDVLSHLVTVAPADYRDVIGLQAADFVAWHVNRYYTTGEDWAGLATGPLRSPSLPQYWKYENLLRAMPDGWTFTPKEID